MKFFDLNYLELEHTLNGKTLTIALKDFVISNPEYLPEEVREKIKKFTDYIDYWAVDFNYRDDTFHNMWQSFMTRDYLRVLPRGSKRAHNNGFNSDCQFRFKKLKKYLHSKKNFNNFNQLVKLKG